MKEQLQLRRNDVVIIDYGVGNHLSVANALRFLGYPFRVSDKKEDLEQASAFILPGVGAFGEAMMNLKQRDLIEPLEEQVLQEKKPILGICLGMQLLAEDSQEKGEHKGLGWIPGHVVAIEARGDLRVPHVGWNEIEILKQDPLFNRLNGQPHFYFDHSFCMECDASVVAAQCQYGQPITAAVQKDNIFGVQFHPEKGQNNGLRILRAFMNFVNQESLALQTC